MKEYIYIPVYVSDDKYSPATVNPRLFFYNGTKECMDYYIQGDNVNNLVSRYPYFDNYSGNDTFPDSKSLLFYNEDVVFGVKPTNSLYTNYWGTYISLLYNPSTRLLNCSGVIPLMDYFNLNLNDIIEFKGNYYHLRYINNYDVVTGECDIQLLGPIIPDALNLIFNVLPVLPTVFNETPIYDKLNKVVNFYGSILSEGSSSITDSGFVWNEIGNPTILDNKLPEIVTIGDFTKTLYMGFMDYEKYYYVNSYASNSEGLSYGEQLPFTSGQEISTTIYQTLIFDGNVTSYSNDLIGMKNDIYFTEDKQIVLDLGYFQAEIYYGQLTVYLHSGVVPSSTIINVEVVFGINTYSYQVEMNTGESISNTIPSVDEWDSITVTSIVQSDQTNYRLFTDYTKSLKSLVYNAGTNTTKLTQTITFYKLVSFDYLNGFAIYNNGLEWLYNTTEYNFTNLKNISNFEITKPTFTGSGILINDDLNVNININDITQLNIIHYDMSYTYS